MAGLCRRPRSSGKRSSNWPAQENCNATRWLAPKVNGRVNASVTVSNSICGDPAPGARKSLEVTYICGSFVKTASANEHRTVYLDCGS